MEATKRISTLDFLAFAKRVETNEWQTLSRRKVFQFVVEHRGIMLTPSTGAPRLITQREIQKFCERFNHSNSLQASDYADHFNKSYLLPIAAIYDERKVEYSLPEEVTPSPTLREGAVMTITVNAYERNSEARRRCIAAHGTACAVCDFSFEHAYGDVAAGFIHVHHVHPLALRGTEHDVDPVADLRPVCPNCHAVIHLRGGCIPVAELREIVRQQRMKTDFNG